MRRRKLPPDKRLDWRDPNMPVFRRVERLGRVSVEPISPEEEQAWCKECVERSKNPHWSEDETYTLRRYKRKKYLRKT